MEESLSIQLREIVGYDRYVGRDEECPIWVVGKVYMLQGSFIISKAQKFLHYILRRPLD